MRSHIESSVNKVFLLWPENNNTLEFTIPFGPIKLLQTEKAKYKAHRNTKKKTKQKKNIVLWFWQITKLVSYQIIQL